MSRGARLWQSRWFWPAIIVLIFGIPLVVGLGRTDYENDEAAHSLTVEAMVKDGDWLTPKNVSQGGVFLEKPPLKFWIVAAPIRLGLLPDDEFGMRFWDAVFASLAFLYVFAIGRRLAGPLCGFGAVMILFVHQPLVFEHGLLANDMEAALLLAFSGGVHHYLAWSEGTDARGRSRHIFAVALFVAFGFMVKFVAIAFLPLVLTVVTLSSRHTRSRLRADWRRWLAAAIVALGLISPWFLYQFHQFGAGVWRTMFGDHVYRRFTASLDPSHLHPWPFYWVRIAEELWQSGAFSAACAGLILLLVQAAKGRSLRAGAVLLWFALPLALMSLMTSKLYHYAYPYLPPFALAGGYAAAVLAALAWSSPATFVRRLDEWTVRTAPWTRRRGVRTAALAIACAAVVIAAATHVASVGGGYLHLKVGDTVFRNTSVFRPVVVAVLMCAVAGLLGTGLRVALVTAVIALLLPVSGYARSLSRLSADNHPLRSISRCALQVAARAQPGTIGSGVWIESEYVPQFWFCYFHALGAWQERQAASDPTVFMHLYIPGMQTPVLLSSERYDQFERAMRSQESDLVQRVARKTGLEVAAVKAAAEGAYTTSVRFPDEVLMLPGPFSACAVEYERGRVGAR